MPDENGSPTREELDARNAVRGIMVSSRESVEAQLREVAQIVAPWAGKAKKSGKPKGHDRSETAGETRAEEPAEE